MSEGLRSSAMAMTTFSSRARDITVAFACVSFLLGACGSDGEPPVDQDQGVSDAKVDVSSFTFEDLVSACVRLAAWTRKAVA